MLAHATSDRPGRPQQPRRQLHEDEEPERWPGPFRKRSPRTYDDIDPPDQPLTREQFRDKYGY